MNEANRERESWSGIEEEAIGCGEVLHGQDESRAGRLP